MIFSSCVMDRVVPLATVKNQSNRDIFIIMLGNDSDIKDSSLFNMSGAISIDQDSSSLVFEDFVTNPNEKKAFFNIFNKDSVVKYSKLGIISGIVSKSFIEKFSIDFDSLKKNDTVIYKGQK